MSTPVSWHLNTKVREGMLAELRSLMTEMVESTEAETGTLDYEWFLSADEKVCHLHERYVDSDAALIHLNNFVSRFAERFAACLELQTLHVFGDASSELRAMHGAFGAEFLENFGGFRR